MAATQRLMKTQVVIPSHQCHYCFYQYTTLHPCIFCNNCLSKCNDVIDRSTSGLIRRNIHMTMQREKTLKLKATGPDGLVPRGTSGGSFSNTPEVDTRASSGGSFRSPQEETRWRILEKKALTLEKRATRCGFCLPTEKRSRLVRYCGHCQKHMCGACDVKHSKHTLCKHHATVDLLAENNSALM